MQARLRTPRILFGAMFGATVMFLVVLFVVERPESRPLDPMFPPMFAVVALAVLATSFILPAKQLAVAFKSRDLPVAEEADPEASDVIPYRDAPKRRVFANPKQAAARAFALYNTRFILEMALSESVALFGFVLGFLGHPLVVFLPFFVVSWVAMALRFPTPKKIFGPLERAFDARLPLDQL